MRLTTSPVLLVWVDRFLDYIPGVSTVSNLTIIFFKYVSPKKDVSEANHYYSLVKDKPIKRVVVLLFPFVGNCIYFIYDFANGLKCLHRYIRPQPEELFQWGWACLGQKEPDSRKKALNYFMRAAEYGHPESMYNVGISMLKGNGIAKDEKKGFEWILKAAEKNVAEAILVAARTYKESLNLKKAVEWFEKGALLNEPECMYSFGCSLLYGLGNVRNEKRGFEWLLKCAEKGFVDAMEKVAECYIQGLGVSSNVQKGVEWFEKGARYNQPECMYGFGYSLLYGTVDVKDPKRGFEWLMKAAEEKVPAAMEKVGGCYYDGLGVQKDLGKAFEWFEKAAKENHVKAMNNVAYCYIEGKGVQKDDKMAFQWFLKSAQLKNPTGQYEVALCYLNGEGVEKDEKVALDWFEKAASNNHKDAIKYLKDRQAVKPL